jgi:hypothetical protein
VLEVSVVSEDADSDVRLDWTDVLDAGAVFEVQGVEGKTELTEVEDCGSAVEDEEETRVPWADVAAGLGFSVM